MNELGIKINSILRIADATHICILKQKIQINDTHICTAKKQTNLKSITLKKIYRKLE